MHPDPEGEKTGTIQEKPRTDLLENPKGYRIPILWMTVSV